jgi:AAA+ ATPase superfamily predicted ATPase
MTIHHFRKDDIILGDIFCWPYFELSSLGSDLDKPIIIKKDVVNQILNNNLVLITGDRNSGKSSIAKMLYKNLSEKGYICILCNPESFTTDQPDHIDRSVEKAFIIQYNKEQLEIFRQEDRERKIIIIDDFDRVRRAKGKQTNILEYLITQF